MFGTQFIGNTSTKTVCHPSPTHLPIPKALEGLSAARGGGLHLHKKGLTARRGTGSCCYQKNGSEVFILGLFKKVSPGGGQGEAPSTQQGTRNGAVSNVEQATTHEKNKNTLSDLLAKPEFLRQFSKARDASEALDIISETASKVTLTSSDQHPILSQSDVRELISHCLEVDRVDLGLSILKAMSRTTCGVAASGKGISSWPAADVETVQAVVLGLCQQVRVSDAMDVMEGIQQQGLPSSNEVPFGHVVDCPLSPGDPLTVVRPEEGAKPVNCSVTRYQFEVFSGTVSKISSDALNKSDNIFLALGRFTGIWKTPIMQAVHEMVVLAPNGSGRTFRFGTESADLPCSEGERISVVCAPSQSASGGMFGSGPPGKKPGEPLAISNHKSRSLVNLLPAPASLEASGIPGWVVPAAVLFAGTDAASWFMDPGLPLLIAAGTASVAGAAVAGNEFLLPRLKQLPRNSVNVERVRQELLGQHKDLITKIVDLLDDSASDLRSLAKLWQLESKMASVGAAGSYNARMERIAKARENLEARIKGDVELLYGFSKVAKMIEIEVEMDVDVAYAEINGIGKELQKLAEVEMLQQQMVYQAEAQDEVERLLKTGN